jgi:nitroreductase
MHSPSYRPVPFHLDRYPEEEMRRRALAFRELMNRRRSVRYFSDEPVQQALIEQAIRTAGTAPSGAHMQPWTFVAINDPAVKHRIRVAAEAEERTSYEGRMSEEWLQALATIGTTWEKPFLETVPWIVVIFDRLYGLDE